MPKGQPKKSKSAIERAIHSRERGIERMRLHIKRIREQAEQEIAVVEKRIAEREVLLHALKAGSLKE